MRTIEEIRQDIKKSDDSVGIVRGFEYLNLFMELAQAQDAEIARLRQQLEWQPIETAPRDEMIEIIHQWIKIPQIVRWTSKYHSPYDRLIQGFFRVEWPFDYIPLEIITG